MLDTGVRQRMAERAVSVRGSRANRKALICFAPRSRISSAHRSNNAVRPIPGEHVSVPHFGSNDVFAFEPVEDAMGQTHGYSGFVRQIVDSP